MGRRRKSSFAKDFSLDPETAHGIFIVAVFAVAALLFFSVFDVAGQVGEAIDSGMARMLGWDRIVLPFFLVAIGIRELSPKRFHLKGANYVGFVLSFLSVNPFVQIAALADAPITEEEMATLGGKLGNLLAEPFMAFLGSIGAATIFGAIALISVLLIFNISLRALVAAIVACFVLLQKALLLLVAPMKWIAAQKTARAEERIRASLSVPVQPAATPLPVQMRSVSSGRDEEAEESDEEESEGDEEELPPPKPKKRQPKIEVPLELLSRRDQRPTAGDITRNQTIIQRTLETFGIAVEMGDVATGPTVTQFTLKPSEGVKLTKITALHNDLALALAAHPIRIEAPIPGKSLVGIEVPNQSVATVGLRELFESKEWRDHKVTLPFGLGRDVSGKAWIADVGRMPHMLVAGATGSGKSVCLNTLIMSLVYAMGPDELKMILVDPKRVELQIYNGIPHLITPMITNVEKTVNALKWGLREMDRRFDVLSKFGVRDIGSYNARAEEKLPYIVIMIDELADLMVTAMQEVEGPIVRLAQMSRAVGIHLVLATQRPSTDVLTGLIKANIPARIAFAVASSIDSRTILDGVGAEKLIGRGDMLFQTAEMGTPKRIQGTFISDDEIRRVVEFLKSKYDEVEYDESIVERAKSGGGSATSNGIDDDADPLIPQAKEEILRAGKASASLLQRRLQVGYARAARLLDLLEQDGFVGPVNGAKPRKILQVEFTKGMDQAPIPQAPIAHPVLDQVNREIPEIESEEDAK